VRVQTKTVESVNEWLLAHRKKTSTTPGAFRGMPVPFIDPAHANLPKCPADSIKSAPAKKKHEGDTVKRSNNEKSTTSDPEDHDHNENEKEETRIQNTRHHDMWNMISTVVNGPGDAADKLRLIQTLTDLASSTETAARAPPRPVLAQPVFNAATPPRPILNAATPPRPIFNAATPPRPVFNATPIMDMETPPLDEQHFALRDATTGAAKMLEFTPARAELKKQDDNFHETQVRKMENKKQEEEHIVEAQVPEKPSLPEAQVPEEFSLPEAQVPEEFYLPEAQVPEEFSLPEAQVPEEDKMQEEHSLPETEVIDSKSNTAEEKDKPAEKKQQEKDLPETEIQVIDAGCHEDAQENAKVNVKKRRRRL
jgi:hypothetical protein